MLATLLLTLALTVSEPALPAPADLVRNALSGTPADWPLASRLQAVQQQLHDRGGPFYAALADTDGDGLTDLLLASTRRHSEPAATGYPTAIFRGADLAKGRFQPHVLSKGEGGFFRGLERTGDINGDGKPETVISYQFHGTGYHRLWQNGAYRHHSTAGQPPATARQAVSDGEFWFRRQEPARALPLFQQALRLPGEEVDGDWRPLIHLRTGQIQALLGRRQEAVGALRQAVAAGGALGKSAAAFLGRYDAGPGLEAALAAQLSDEPYHTGIWAVAPGFAQVALQAYLTRHGSAEGFPAPQQIRADLDGDGQPEWWVRPERGATPGHDLLAVKTPQGWRVGEVYTGDAGAVTAEKVGRRHRLRLSDLADGNSLHSLDWNGKLVRVEGSRDFVLQQPLLPEWPERCLDERRTTAR